MRKVFDSSVVSEVILVRDALLRHGIDASIQNQHSGFSAVPEFRPPAGVWVTHDADHEAACQMVQDTLATLDAKVEAAPWRCAGCNTENPASFELCWNCGREAGSSSRA